MHLPRFNNSLTRRLAGCFLRVVILVTPLQERALAVSTILGDLHNRIKYL